MSFFVVNEKEYRARPFDFNLVCELEDMGVALEEMQKKSRSVLRAYFALCAEMSLDFAGRQLEEHFIKGGSFDEIFGAFGEEMEKSDFFQTLAKRAGAREEANQKKEGQESAENGAGQ